MDNLISLMCFGALILFALFAFLSLTGWGRRSTNSPFDTAGNEVPRYDDPNVRSGGSFGGTFGGAHSTGRGVTLGGDSPRHDDPNVRRGGSFGG